MIKILGKILSSGVGFALAAFVTAIVAFAPGPAAAQVKDCITPKWDLVGCQPAPFDILSVNIPTGRFNQEGQLDATATEEQVRAGQRYLELNLGLFRNFERVHWVHLVPSKFNTESQQWEGGDMDARSDGRALTIAGKCLYAGHANRGGGERPLEIFRIQDDPVANAPVHVGAIPVPQAGADDSIMSARLYTKASGQQTIILARDVSTDEGGLWTYEMDPDTCLLVKEARGYEWGGDMHEMGMWVDPSNEYRTLIVGAAFNGQGNPDPYREGFVNPDIRVLAITDEKTGEMLEHPIALAHFTLSEVGGPLPRERPDDNGWFADGAFPNYEHIIDNQTATRINYPAQQSNRAHLTTWSPDGRRVYVGGGTAGFYILDSSAIVDNTDAALAAKNAGCNWESSSIWVDGVVGGEIDASRLTEPVTDCLHMVVFNEPSVQKVAADGNVLSFVRYVDKSRFDPFPGHYPNTGIHSAIEVPNRPSPDARNVVDGVTGPRARYVILTSETFRCPGSFTYMINIEIESTPTLTNTFGLRANDVERCSQIATEHEDGSPRRLPFWMAHNPTVFENFFVVSWYGHGIRAVDISNPYNMREIGHAVSAPLGQDRSYPVFNDGLVYWVNNRNGLHVARYTGPYANEVSSEWVHVGNDVLHK